MAALKAVSFSIVALGLLCTNVEANAIQGVWHSRHHATPITHHARAAKPSVPSPPSPAIMVPTAPSPATSAALEPPRPLQATASPPATTVPQAPLATGPSEAPPVRAPTASRFDSTFAYDGFINLGDGPYAGAALLTDGGAQPWYSSPAVQPFFGGVPDAQERDAFSRSVLEKVEAAYAGSGLDLELTTDPTAPAAHSLSVVSGTSYGPNPDAVGITDMGNDGFTFIDKLAYARSLDDLEWAVANNVAHELMHAFGVEHQDRTGAYLDAATVSWELLAGPGAAFSPEAIAELAAADLRARSTPVGTFAAQGLSHAEATELIAPVPEPTALVAWSLLGVAAIVVRRGRRA